MSCHFIDLYLSCGGCAGIYLYFMCWSVNGSVFLVCCVFDVVCELFGETIRKYVGVVAILLLNAMEVFSVGGGALLDIPCVFFQRMCVLCL